MGRNSVRSGGLSRTSAVGFFSALALALGILAAPPSAAAQSEQVLLQQMFEITDQSLDNFVSLSAKLGPLGVKIGNLPLGAKKRKKLATKAKKAVTSFLKTEQALFQSFTLIEAQSAGSAILALEGSFYRNQHTAYLKLKSRVTAK